MNYESVPFYQFSATTIAYAATWLQGNGYLSDDDLIAFLKKLLNDPKVSVGGQLAIEEALYKRDSL